MPPSGLRLGLFYLRADESNGLAKREILGLPLKRKEELLEVERARAEVPELEGGVRVGLEERKESTFEVLEGVGEKQGEGRAHLSEQKTESRFTLHTARDESVLVVERLDLLEVEGVAIDGLQQPVMEPDSLKLVLARIAVDSLEHQRL